VLRTVLAARSNTSGFTPKHDRRDARLILDVLLQDRFPQPNSGIYERCYGTVISGMKMRSRLQRTLQAIANHEQDTNRGSRSWKRYNTS
jgi:hypothetical protein